MESRTKWYDNFKKEGKKNYQSCVVNLKSDGFFPVNTIINLKNLLP